MQNDPNFFYFAYATSDAVKDVSGGEPTYTRKLSYFGRLNYDYAGKYMAQFSLRADAADLSGCQRTNVGAISRQFLWVGFFRRKIL